MYAAPFEFVAISEWDEAVGFLEEHADEEPKVIAGGQSLVPIMNLRLAEPTHIVDINGVAAEEIRREGDVLVIPALTRHAALETSSLLAEDCPLLSEAASLIGNARVRHRGTIGGSLAHADPSAELPCAAIATDAGIVTVGPSGSRTIPAREFFESYLTTSLGPSELVREVRIPVMPHATGWAFVEFVRRAGDFAVVEVAAIVEVETGSGECRRAELVVGGVSDRPVRLEEAASLVGGLATDASIRAAADRARDLVEPPGSEYASSDHRRHLVGVLTQRALSLALTRARERSGPT